MNGLVPGTGVLVPGGGVPPVRVKTAVGEVGEFGEEVEKGFEEDIPGSLACVVNRNGGERMGGVPGHHIFHHERKD